MLLLEQIGMEILFAIVGIRFLGRVMCSLSFTQLLVGNANIGGGNNETSIKFRQY